MNILEEQAVENSSVNSDSYDEELAEFVRKIIQMGGEMAASRKFV